MFGALAFGVGYFAQGPAQALTFYGPVPESGEGSAGEPSTGQGSADFITTGSGAQVTYVRGTGARE